MAMRGQREHLQVEDWRTCRAIVNAEFWMGASGNPLSAKRAHASLRRGEKLASYSEIDTNFPIPSEYRYNHF
jgi:hypothetical protein